MKESEMKSIDINSEDFGSLLKLMDRHEDYDSTIIGENEFGERVFVTILSDSICVRTYQANNWIRENVFWRDGTYEELFDGRW